MTNLQRLLSVLNLEGEKEEQAILDYFKEQDADEFEINGFLYVLYKAKQIGDILYEQYEREFDEFADYVNRYRGPNHYKAVTVVADDIIQYRVDKADLELDLENHDYVGEVDNLYIYKKFEW